MSLFHSLLLPMKEATTYVTSSFIVVTNEGSHYIYHIFIHCCYEWRKPLHMSHLHSLLLPMKEATTYVPTSFIVETVLSHRQKTAPYTYVSRYRVGCDCKAKNLIIIIYTILLQHWWVSSRTAAWNRYQFVSKLSEPMVIHLITTKFIERQFIEQNNSFVMLLWSYTLPCMVFYGVLLSAFSEWKHKRPHTNTVDVLSCFGWVGASHICLRSDLSIFLGRISSKKFLSYKVSQIAIYVARQVWSAWVTHLDTSYVLHGGRYWPNNQQIPKFLVTSWILVAISYFIFSRIKICIKLESLSLQYSVIPLVSGSRGCMTSPKVASFWWFDAIAKRNENISSI